MNPILDINLIFLAGLIAVYVGPMILGNWLAEQGYERAGGVLMALGVLAFVISILAVVGFVVWGFFE